MHLRGMHKTVATSSRFKSATMSDCADMGRTALDCCHMLMQDTSSVRKQSPRGSGHPRRGAARHVECLGTPNSSSIGARREPIYAETIFRGCFEAREGEGSAARGTWRAKSDFRRIAGNDQNRVSDLLNHLLYRPKISKRHLEKVLDRVDEKIGEQEVVEDDAQGTGRRLR